MKTLTEITKLVTFILTEVEETRNSDMKLYEIVCETLNPNAMRKPFRYAITHLHDLGLPPFESVRRARQKAQAKNPELRACQEIEQARAVNEEAYEKYAIS